MEDKKNEFKIFGENIRGGETRTIDLSAARLYTHAELSIPVRIVCGRKPGPRLFVCAAIHGDEINGVEIIRRLLNLDLLKKLRGTLVAIPVVNVHGFVTLSRYFPDRRDLNRSFPGTENGSLASRIAWLFMTEIINNCTHGLDFHTAAGHRYNLPQIRASLDDDQTIALARSFGAPVILHSNVKDGSLRQAATEAGKPSLLFEAGEALRFDEAAIRLGVRGALSVMRHLQMLPARKARPFREPFIARSGHWVRAPQSGILRVGRIRLGSRVEKGQTLGSIKDLFAEEGVEVVAPFDGLITGKTNLPLVSEGDALVHIARIEEENGDRTDLTDWDRSANFATRTPL